VGDTIQLKLTQSSPHPLYTEGKIVEKIHSPYSIKVKLNNVQENKYGENRGITTLPFLLEDCCLRVNEKMYQDVSTHLRHRYEGYEDKILELLILPDDAIV
jgi:hypothetical protein